MDISVIVPLYKGKKFINQIVEMVERNVKVLNICNKKQVEVIFVNDFPEEIISKYEIKDTNVTINIVNNEINKGIHQSRVNGLNEAIGEFVLFLDQDDDIKDNYLQSQLGKIGNADAVLCNGIHRGNKIIYKDKIAQRHAACKEEYHKQDAIISPGQVLIRRISIPSEWKENILKENGSDDVLLWLLMLRNCGIFSINTEVLYKHNEDGENTSLNFEKMSQSVKELLEVVTHLFNEEDVELIKSIHEPRIEKYNQYIDVLNNWSRIVDRLKQLISLNKYSTTAIYGKGVIGQKLYNSLLEENIEISFFIDKNAKIEEKEKIVVKEIGQIKDNIDLVIVTPLFDKEKIKHNLEKNTFIKNYIMIDCW